MIATLLALSAVAPVQQAPQPYIMLDRKFKANEVLNYRVTSRLDYQSRQIGSETFFPARYDVQYDFSMRVLQLLEEGFARVRYERPTMTFTEGETAESLPKTNVEKVNLKNELTLSPANEITNVKEIQSLVPALRVASFAPNSMTAQQDPIAQFTGELQRLALFLGSLDSALDLNPKLPFDEVRVGDTWRRTVSYQPRQLAGSNRQAVQRLDYVYSYDGVVDSNGQKVHRVTAKLNLDTDAAPYINQLYGATARETGLREVKLQLDVEIKFDLDLNTRATLLAAATSKGRYTIGLSAIPDQAYQETLLNGRSTMRLVR